MNYSRQSGLRIVRNIVYLHQRIYVMILYSADGESIVRVW